MPRKWGHANEPIDKPFSMVEGRTPKVHYLSSVKPCGSGVSRRRRPSFHPELPKPAAMQQSSAFAPGEAGCPNRSPLPVNLVFPPPSWSPSNPTATDQGSGRQGDLEVPKVCLQASPHHALTHEDEDLSRYMAEFSDDFAELRVADSASRSGGVLVPWLAHLRRS